MSGGPSLSVLASPRDRKVIPFCEKHEYGGTIRFSGTAVASFQIHTSRYTALADHSPLSDSSVKMRQFVLRYIQIDLVALVVPDYIYQALQPDGKFISNN